MATIEEGADLYTFINVFRVAAENQQALVGLLIRATEETMQHQPGFVSASIYRSYNGTHVVNYAQWRSKEDFEAMRQNEEAQPHMRACGGVG